VVEFRLLGSLEARVDGVSVDLGGARRRTVLAMLALDAGRVVPVARLIDGVWGEAPPASAATALHGHISQLRRVLGDGVIETRPPGYRLIADDHAIDIRRLEAALEQARRDLAAGDPEAARAGLVGVEEPPLSDLRDAPFAAAAVPALEELVTSAAEERIDAELALGRGRELVGELRKRVGADPLRERPRRQLMLALQAAGRRTEALAVYEDGRRALSEELGIDPGAALRALHERILREEPDAPAPTAPGDDPPPAGPRRRRGLVLAALGLTIGVACVAIVLTGGDAAPSVPALRGPGVVRVDARTLTVSDAVAVPGTPTGLAAGHGRAWVINADDQTISELAATGRVRRTFSTGRTPTSIAVSADGLWLTEGAPSGQSIVPRTVSAAHLTGSLLTVGSRVRLPGGGGDEDPAGTRVAVGAHVVWVVAAGGDLVRLDAATGHIDRVFHINARAVATDGDLARVLTRDGTLTSVTETATTTGAPLSVGTGPSALAAGGGAVWLLSPDAGTVTRVEPDAAGQPVETTVGVGASDIAYGAGAAWVLDPQRQRLVRLDATTAAVTGAVDIGEVPRAVTVADGSVWVSASPRMAPLASSCTTSASAARADVRIVAELPLRRGPRSPTADMARAIEATVARRGGRAGRLRVGLTLCDDSTAARATFDPEKCAANARSYAADPRIVVEVGPYNSGCAERQIPIAASAPGGPLGMVSPTATDPLLTRTRRPGAFTRVIATDADQAAVMAAELHRRGLRRVFVLDDADGTNTYGLTVASYFAAAAARDGLKVVGRASWPGLRPQALSRRVTAARPDVVYVSGLVDAGAGAMIRRLPHVQLAGPDLLLPVGSLYRDSAGTARGMLLTTTFARGGPLHYATDATEVALDAIARSDGTRRSVAAELQRSRRFTASGDLADASVALLEVRHGGSRRLLSTDGARRIGVRSP
jgi:DNA-binding SARP family transcriptional activator